MDNYYDRFSISTKSCGSPSIFPPWYYDGDEDRDDLTPLIDQYVLESSSDILDRLDNILNYTKERINKFFRSQGFQLCDGDINLILKRIGEINVPKNI